MAFPVPSHLPRRAAPQDVTSKILSTMEEATTKSLTASLAQSWLEELDVTIQSTKEKIRERIHANLPEFERQLQTSISVQTRLRTLTTEVDSLAHSLSDPESGLVPSLIKTLTAHSTLAQKATNARIKHDNLSHLLRCREQSSSLEVLVKNGDLPEAVGACTNMEGLLRDAPVALAQSNVLLNLKHKFNAAKARVEDQLSDAYSRCVLVAPHEIIVAPTVQVRQSARMLSLPEILSSLSRTSLDNHLNTLRRDITTHYIDIFLTQPMSVVEEDFKLTCFPSPPNDEIIGLRIENLSRILQFLSTHLFAHLPVPQSLSFLLSLSKPVSSSVLNNLLIPNLPSSFNRLRSFLELLRSAIAFEKTCTIGLLGNDSSDMPIKAWADGVGGHYERQRRVHILESCRSKILEPENPSDAFYVEVDVVQVDPEPRVLPVQEEIAEDVDADAWGLDEEQGSSSAATKVDEDGWGFEEDNRRKDEDGWSFDDEGDVDANTSTKVDDDGWGFNDDVLEESADSPAKEHSKPATNGHGPEPEPDPEAEDAWGLSKNTAAAEEADETNWDDPWGDSSAAPPSTSPESPRPPTAPSVKAPPKVATRLEKLANKSKKGLNGNSPMISPLIGTPVSPNIFSPAKVTLPPPSPSVVPQPRSPQQTSSTSSDKHTEKRPPNLSFSAPPPPKEKYVVSNKMKYILALIRETLRESREFADSRILPSTSSSQTSSVPGSILFSTSASVLDLYRALYPVVFGAQLQLLEGPMKFSNDCLYLGKEVEMTRKELSGPGIETIKGRFDECGHALKILGDSWYGDTIEKQRQVVDNILTDGTQNFAFTGDQARYDECENAMNWVLQEIRRVSQKWKGVLTQSKYYTAIGSVTDAALSRVLQDILALGDIPELESHRLSELCRILLALEGIYAEDPEQPSFVAAYVPSWLKFSYLSELLEASLADITYLFEEGALVDFEVEELARLVRALFSDTTLRTNTINKIMSGHPVSK